MKQYRIRREVLTFFILIFASILAAHAQEAAQQEAAGPTVTVRMTVTASGLSDGSTPTVTQNDVTVRQRRDTCKSPNGSLRAELQRDSICSS